MSEKQRRRQQVCFEPWRCVKVYTSEALQRADSKDSISEGRNKGQRSEKHK